jgi:hypothetical protein
MNVFTRIERFFRKIEAYAEIPTTGSMKGINEKIMLTVLGVLAVLTKEVKRGPASESIPRCIPLCAYP